MFLLDGNPLSPDVPFEHDGISYPANWLRLASPEEREAIGITEVPDPEPYDQRFYWAPDLPKDHAQLVSQWVAQTKTTAFTLIQPSDWYFTREQDNGTPVPAEVKTEREAIRAKSREKVAAIQATTSTEELAAYITGSEYPVWPQPES